MKSGIGALLLLLLSLPAWPQDTLFLESFEATSNSFTLNTTDQGSIGSAGYNRWVVNDSYLGGSGSLICLGFPFTFNVANTAAQPAAIDQANGNYLHLLSEDAQASNILNANYRAADGLCANAQNYFVRMSQDISTAQLTDVSLSFWWVCGGSPNNFGEVYVSYDGGNSWQPTQGTPLYNNQTTWTQATLSDTAFAGKSQLRFGFRFTNNVSTTASDPGFAIDDVLITGEQALSLSTDSVSRLALCASGDSLTVYFTAAGLFDPSNQFIAELSDATGSFGLPTVIGSISSNVTGTGAISATLPSGLPAGNGYRVRVRASTPSLTANDNGLDLELTPVNLAQGIRADPTALCPGDSSLLSASNTQGALQWQSGSSLGVFDDLSGADSSSYSWQPDSSVLVRLIASGGVCPADTSESILVEVLPIEAAFSTASSGPLTVVFSDQTNGATSWEWDFGDGTTGQGSNPTHVFPAGATYQVCLTATNAAGCQDTRCQDITIESVGMARNGGSLTVYPNPVRDLLRVSWSGGAMQMSLVDAQGRVVRRQEAEEAPIHISLQALPTGIYWLRMSQDGSEVRQLVIKQ